MKKTSFNSLRTQKIDKKKSRQTFSESLFESLDSSLWPGERKQKQDGHINSDSEKTEVVQAMKDHVEARLEQETKNDLEIPGGVITKKTESARLLSEQTYPVLSLPELKSELSDIKGMRYQTKAAGPVKILFLSDDFYPDAQINPEVEFLAEITSFYFSSGSDLLFSKMAKAMNFQESDLALSSLFCGDQKLEKLCYQEIAFFKPELVITLGAKTSAFLLQERKRIAEVHGQVFKRSLNTSEGLLDLSIMPLFHPEFLNANPNMKKAAWVDLQKAMKIVS